MPDRATQRANGVAAVRPAIVEGEARDVGSVLLPDPLVWTNMHDSAVVDADLPQILALRLGRPSHLGKSYLLERMAAYRTCTEHISLQFEVQIFRTGIRTLKHVVEGADCLEVRESEALRRVHGVADGKGHVVGRVDLRLHGDIPAFGNAELWIESTSASTA